MRRVLLLVGLPVVLLLVGTVILRVPAVDLGISGRYYQGDEAGWASKNHPFFALLYDKGTLPAAVLAGTALLVLLAGLVWAPALRWRKLAAYFLLVVVIGPGLLVNAVFKEHWGRPRPRDVTAFDGANRYERVWEYDASSPGKSFPSGHASMGFCLFAFYFIGKALRRRWAGWAVVVALGLGGALGWARIAQGGHFASDVLWSAGFCYFTALLLARLMKIEQRPFTTGKAISKAGIAGLGVALLGATALAVAVPHQSEKQFGPLLVTAPVSEIEIRLVEAELLVRGGEAFAFGSHVEAFGLLGSKVEDAFEQRGAGGGRFEVKLRQNEKGSFAIFEQPATLDVPVTPGGEVDLEIERGGITLELFEGDWEWDLQAGGDIELRVPDGLDIKITRASVKGGVSNSVPGLEWSAEKGRWKRGVEPGLKVRVAAGGELRLVPIDR